MYYKFINILFNYKCINWDLDNLKVNNFTRRLSLVFFCYLNLLFIIYVYIIIFLVLLYFQNLCYLIELSLIMYGDLKSLKYLNHRKYINGLSYTLPEYVMEYFFAQH